MLRSVGRSGSRNTDRGQALAEFALVAPIMALILAGLVQFAFIYERQIGIENAVRDAARRASTLSTVNSSEASTNGAWTWNLLTGPGGLLQSNVQAYDGSQLISASVCYRTAVNAAGFNEVLVKVSAAYAHPLFLPIISQILDGIDSNPDKALDIATSSEFTVENDAESNASVGGTPVGWPGGSC